MEPQKSVVMNKDIFVSIITPIYNDWERMAHCISALSTQNYPVHLYEIILVNNNPGHPPPNEFSMPSNCRIIAEPKPGSYAARNAGIRAATGEIIGFTDSDCIPHRNWIRNAVDFLTLHKKYSRVAGRIELLYQSETLTPGELYEKVYAFNQHRYVERDGTGVTANMFSYRFVFDSVGLFNGDLLSGGDYEWGVRARDANFSIGYGHEVVVSHPARSSVKDPATKAKRVGGGHALFKYQLSSKAMALFYLLNHLRPPLRSFRMVFKRGRDLSATQKLTVLSIHYYLSVVTAWERFRVHLGKMPNRV